MKNYIALIVEDNPALPIGMLGILKAGHWFVPINPAFPKDRVNYIINDCGIHIILTDRLNYENVREMVAQNRLVEHVLCIDDDFAPEHSASESLLSSVSTSEPAYIIYTSGSTGRPKGVPITHHHLVPLFTWFRECFRLGSHTRVLQNLSYTFDFGVFELLTTLLYGGTLVFVDKKAMGDYGQYSRIINRHFINTMHSTPVFFNSIAASGEKMPQLSIVHLGGERLTGQIVKNIAAKVAPLCKIYNGYGPTETTINCALFTLTAEQGLRLEDSANIPIGKPTALHTLYIVDKQFNPQPVGVAGELCIAGPSVSAGYLNNPALTAEKFCTHTSLANSDILYHSGDLVRWLLDGNIEFLGRIDLQVKIRGYRIELGEIESSLLKHPDIKGAVVIDREQQNGNRYLCAYYVADSSHTLTVAMLKEHLTQELPDYMIPAYFIHLEQLPLTIHGKVDRKVLPLPDESTIVTGVQYEAATSSTEKELVKIWQELLGMERIGIQDDFFDIGGDSIRVGRCIALIRESLAVEIPMRKFFEKPYIKALAVEIEKQDQRVSAIPKASRDGDIPLSFSQERLWFLQTLDAENTAYFVPRLIRVKGNLDVTLLERTFTEIIRRHEILRTAFITRDGVPMQQVLPPYYFNIPVLPVQEEQVEQWVSEEGNKAFDFEKGSLLRVTLLKLGETEFLIVLTEHHLIHDGWTQGVLLNEFIRIFSAYSEHKEHDLRELPIQYADYALWQRAYLQGERLQRHLDYWLEKLAGLIPVLELPSDRPRPSVMSGLGDLKEFRLTTQMTDQLKEFSRMHNVTLFMTMLALFKTLLYRYTGEEDICAGTGLANRSYKEMEDMLGMVINTLPLRTHTTGAMNFSQYLARVKETCLEAYQHQDTPFGKIVEVLGQERSLSYNPIFQVLFSFMDTPTDHLWLPGLELLLEPTHNYSAKFDLNLVVVPPLQQQGDGTLAMQNDQILVEWEYNVDIFDGATMDRMIHHYIRLIEAILLNPNTRILDLPMLDQYEINHILYDFNADMVAYPKEKTIHELFIEQAERTPNDTAIIGTKNGGSSITYTELNHKSQQLAHYLMVQGVLPGDIIAILGERSIYTIIGVLGILKAGAAYLPIDPDYPEERKQYMLTDSAVKILLSENIIQSATPILPVTHVTPIPPITPINLAYIIYTSGSTGEPKGVMVTHQNVVRLVKNTNYVEFNPHDCILQTGALEFDASTFEIWGSLLNGLKLILVDKETLLTPEKLKFSIHEHHVTTMWMTAPLFNQMLQADIHVFAGLKNLLVGGDVLSPLHISRLRLQYPRLNVINGYGPTENTTFSTTFLIQQEYSLNIPIGKPINNSTAYIIDKVNHLSPVGVPGELVVGGDGLAMGYLNNPQLTQDKFLTLSISSLTSTLSIKIYKTGDLARWLPDGNIEFLGRIDQQVKIRGFRIELGEIEAQLLKYQGLSDVVVLSEKDKNGDKYLAAYFVADTVLSDIQLRYHLLVDLPEYMIPSYFIQLEKIPLAATGKVDRSALPQPELKKINTYVAPSNETEALLTDTWYYILSRDPLQSPIGIDDNFFQMGGHSLKATSLLANIHKVFNVKIPLAEIFKRPTIRGQADYIHHAIGENYIQIDPVEEKEYYALSSAQKRLYFLQQMDMAGTAYNISAAWMLEGMLDTHRVEHAVEQLIQRHESFRTSFTVIDEEPVQRIHSDFFFAIEYLEASQLDDFIRPFFLYTAPLLRVGLVQLEEKKHILLVDQHHIISDGFSMEILGYEFAAFLAGKDLPVLALQYKDYSEWQRFERASEDLFKQGEFWRGLFAEEIPVLALPIDNARPVVQSFAGNRIKFALSNDISAALNTMALKTETTLYMVLLSLYNIFLAKLSGQEDIVIGTPIAGRRHADLEKIIGMFVNTLALRNYPVAGKTWFDFLYEVKESTLKAFDNQEYQYEDIVDEVVVTRDISRNPLFDTLFTLQNEATQAMAIPGLTFSTYQQERKTAKFDLSLTVLEVDKKLELTFEYSTHLFNENTIERFITYFNNTVSAVLNNTDTTISAIQIISNAEKTQILHDFNNTATTYPASKTIHELFMEQSARTPNDLAISGQNMVTMEKDALTYAQLNEKSNQIAHFLLGNGILPDDIVGIIGDRAPSTIIGILGILKSGAAYLPIDPDYPEERKHYMLTDSSTKILLTATLIQEATPITPTNLAYIIYTSGSTGTPKGVMVTHQNVIRLVKNTNYIQFIPGDSILQTGAMAFDASTFEIWGALLNGLILVIVDKETIITPDKLKAAIQENNISTMWMTSPLFNQVSQADIDTFAGLKNLLVGGDVLSPVHISSLWNYYPELNIINGYGPTENTTFSTTFLIQRDFSESIPIGKPIANSTAYIIDKNNQLCPIGVPGELIVGGHGITRGYLNNPDLTHDKFISLAIAATPFYKTGDLARWLPDGNIEFLGRLDFQVKIRGFRVELGEIENRLLKHPHIQDVIVVAKKAVEGSGPENSYIAAYFVSHITVKTQELRDYLANQLPDYMIPAYFVPMDYLPLTATGKIDRAKLPEPEFTFEKDFQGPRDHIEEELVKIWCELLAIETPIGIDDNFFHLGGHSLKATSLLSKIHKLFDVVIPLTEIFKSPTIRELSLYIHNAISQQYVGIGPVEAKEYYPQSSSQQRFYILQQMEGIGTSYNMPLILEVTGKLDKHRLEQAVNALIRRHDMLRTSFLLIAEKAVMRVHSHVDFKIEDFAGEISAFIRPFDLSQAPLLRMGLIRKHDENHILIFDMNHIISDGSSMTIFVNELTAIYGGAENQLAPLRIQYQDFAQWQQDRLAAGLLQKHEDYWLTLLAGELPVLEMPLDFPRPAVQSFAGQVLTFEIEAELRGAINRLLEKSGATLYMLALTALEITLFHYTGQNDLIVGTPVAGRNHMDMAPLIGLLLDTVVMRNQIQNEQLVWDFLNHVKVVSLAAFENQVYPFREVIKHIEKTPNFSHNPIFDVMLLVQNFEFSSLSVEGLTFSSYPSQFKSAKVDITFELMEIEDRIHCALEFCTALFKPETIQRFAKHLLTIFAQIVRVLDNESLQIAELNLLEDAEKRHILEVFNTPATAYPAAQMIDQLLSHQAHKTPDAIALLGEQNGACQLTYAELNHKSQQLALYLTAKGVLPDTIVALMVNRSIEMIIGILGILKSGAAYLPIAPNYPEERKQFMLSDSSAQLLLTQHVIQEAIHLTPVTHVTPILPILPITPITPITPTNLAYIIYTSGSTGRPKGVLVEHGNLLAYIHAFEQQYTLFPSDIVIQQASFTFDAFVEELYPILLKGGKLALPDSDSVKDMERLAAFILKHGVTFITASPLMLNELNKSDSTFPIRIYISGGDVLKAHYINNLIATAAVYNTYGPTESTVCATYYSCKAPLPVDVPIGKPIRNYNIVILNKLAQLQAIGLGGELCIAGPGLTRGYLNQPQITHDTFISLPALSPFSSRLYKSGDLARWLPDGNIEFLGRIDFQVKIRGFRIELGEIENLLFKHPHILDAVVAVKEDSSGDKSLVAYVVANQEFSLSQLREYLLNDLPDYMVPAYFIPLETIPLTPSGKVDRRALPDPEIKITGQVVAPRDEIERELISIWCDILNITPSENPLGIDDNFFLLGGHSLKATTLTSRIHKTLHVKIPLAEIFKRPTIREIAAFIHVNHVGGEQFLLIAPVEEKEYYPLSSAQKRLYFLQQMDKTGTEYNLPEIINLQGTIAVEKLALAFKKLIQRHESFRTSFAFIDDHPVQRIHKHVEFTIDTSFAPAAQRSESSQDFITSFIRPFDLTEAPLMRVAFMHIQAEEFFLIVDMHHIISDGISMGVLVKDFMTFYGGQELSRPRIHYKDYAVWKTQHQEKITQQESYWLHQFADDIPVLDLPLDYLRPKVKNFAGSAIKFTLDNPTTRALNILALQQGATLYMVLLAVYNIFLAKVCNQEVIIVGTPTAGRSHADLEQVIGMFVNTLVLKNNPSPSKSVHAFLEELKENTLNAFANQDYQYEELVEKVLKTREAGRNPLFDTMFVLENQDIPTVENHGLKLGPHPFVQTTSKFDLTLICTELDKQISCVLEYGTKLFKPETIQRFVLYLQNIVSAILQNPTQHLDQIDMLPEAEKIQLLFDFNNTTVSYPDNKTIYQLFEDKVDLFPDHIAIIGETASGLAPCQITYRELNQKANQLAQYLCTEQAVQPGDRVPVLMDRSIELIIVLFAIMKARCAYIPVDVSLPVERFRLVFNDASVAIVISQQHYLQKITSIQSQCPGLHAILSIEDLQRMTRHYPVTRPVTGTASDPAYVMYTSGSTGIPKGVLVEHRTIVNTIIWRKNNYEYAPGHVSLQVPPYFFDSSVTDIFTPLLGGACLVLIRDEERSDLTILRKTITLNNVSHFIVVPIFYNVMLEEIAQDLNHVKMICCAGDNFPDELIRKHFDRLPHVRIFNEYGPTENSVNTTAYELTPDTPRAVIGKPISNVTVFVLNKSLFLCPIGVTGELCLAGSSLSRGYLNRPELTAEKFIYFTPPLSNHHSATTLCYRTGDLGRWCPDGNLEFLGRLDNQVKIRGMRVEIGEIENQLMKQDNIKEVVVQLRLDESNSHFLCAYIVPHSFEQSSLEPAQLKEYLAQRLPAYMIPAHFLLLDKLPLTPNGKLDTQALPVPQLEQVEQYTPPRNELEKKMVNIWESVLGKKNIGIHDNFFSIGGDSIKSIQIMSRMDSAGYQLTMKDIFQYPAIADLAPHVEKLHRIPDQSAICGTIPLTPIQRAFFDRFTPHAHHFNQAVLLYSPTPYDIEALEKVFIIIQEIHDALRMTYKIDPQTHEPWQMNQGIDYPLSFQEYDLTHWKNNSTGLLAELNEKINLIHSSIDLENGPMMKLGLFHLHDGDRLFITIHQLVIDDLSWSILIEDLEALYEQLLVDHFPTLPLKTDSFKYWSEQLQEYAYHKTILNEKSYWTHLESDTIPYIHYIEKDFKVAENALKDTRCISFNLEEVQTTLLLGKANHCYNTASTDIILTALGLAIKKTFGLDHLYLTLEGHGRENITSDIDVSRTIGWFTAQYPVLLDISYARNTARQIKEIKETLRKVPNHGIGYGILKYLTQDIPSQKTTNQSQPQIIFRYTPPSSTPINPLSSFQLAPEFIGYTRSLHSEREYELEINGKTSNNCLSITVSYNSTHFKPETITTFTHFFQSQLQHIITFCAAKENREPTPSDFTYKELTIDSLQQVLELYPEVEDIYTLSPMQQGMLFHALLDKTSNSYFQQTAFRLHGELDIPLVEKSLHQLVKRHDILRTAFVHKNTPLPLQVVLQNRPVAFYYQDICHIADSQEKEKYVQEFKAKDKSATFDLSHDILVRISILQLAKADYQFIWSFHHVLMDGWCISIINDEFFAIYDSYVQQHTVQLPPIKPYRTYIQWLEKRDKDESSLYWQNYLAAFDEQTAILPPKIKKNEQQTPYVNKDMSFILDVAKTTRLNHLAIRNNVTLNTLAQTLWAILLGKYTQKEDVVFGTVVSGRPFELDGIESMIGLFINTIPVRIRFHQDMVFTELLKKVQADALTSEAFHYHPLADIQSHSPLKQNLIDHLFEFENYPIADQIQSYGQDNNRNNTGTSISLDNVNVFEQTNFDFNITVGGSGLLRITFYYNGYVLDDDYVTRIAHHYQEAFEQIIQQEEILIADLTMLSPREKNRLLVEFNQTDAQYPAHLTFHDCFVQQVERTPDHIAVAGFSQPLGTGMVFLSYRQLNQKSNQIATILREQGVSSESIVGLLAERSIEMLIGILGILKSGGVYLPIDQEYPKQRVDFILNDSAAKILVTADELNQWLFNDISSQDPTTQEISTNVANLAYIIYTSGTTGKPKGAMIEHRGMVNHMYAKINDLQLDHTSIIAQNASQMFDISVWQFFTALIIGGRTVIFPNLIILEPVNFKQHLIKNKINILEVVPSYLTTFLDIQTQDNTYASLPVLYLLVTGEAVSSNLLKRWFKKYPHIKVVNAYGPTEASDDITHHIMTHAPETDPVTIGAPVQNMKIYILDKTNHLCLQGLTGELCVSGIGVGRGYLNRPELTHDKFLTPSTITPFSQRLYKTGDLARWLPDGNIEFLGRIDHQVKIRGFRIELGEIENLLKEHPAVDEAVVIDRKDNQRQYLCAYFTPATTDEPTTIAPLKKFLEEKLPPYMVPACFMKIDSIPLNVNGKIDRFRLPQPTELDFHTADSYHAPETPLQQMIVDIWQEILCLERIGIHDNFFNLGGNSLDLVRVANQLRAKLGKDIPVATLFNHLTISALENYLASAQLSDVVVETPRNFVMLNGSPESVGNFFFVHEVLGDVSAYLEFCQHLGTQFNCWGVEAEKLAHYVPRNDTVEIISARYIQQMKKIQPHGPYNIVAWSWGGHLALEMAMQLEKIGETLSFLGFFDCSGPKYKINENRVIEKFSIQTERSYIKPFFMATGNTTDLEQINDLDQLWNNAVDYLTNVPGMVDQLRQLLIDNALALPNYFSLTGPELIQCLNLNRVHTSSGLQYIPAGKILTPIHYFRASHNPNRVESWGEHCTDPVIYHEINGDHHSIFRNIDHIKEFARIFSEVVNQEIK